ncbi:MAG TPA: acetolactate synthase small subunit [Verrucomicrobiae bacterium]|nr:acetolactate synthase small subunit [Verrucomicrobiae bacterium]
MHTLTVLVDNYPGVLTRVSGLFSRRGYNIESLTVCETENPDISRMTIVVDGDDWVIEQVTKQLHKLVVVHKISDITAESAVERELALIKVRVRPDNRVEILQTTDIFRARVVDMGRNSLTIEATGDRDKIDALVKTLRPYGIVELARTGIVALVRAEAN